MVSAPVKTNYTFSPKIMIIIFNVIKAFMLSPMILGALDKVIQADGRDLVNVRQLEGEISRMDCKLPSLYLKVS